MSTGTLTRYIRATGNKACPKCAGFVLLERDDWGVRVLHCVNCGWRRYLDR